MDESRNRLSADAIRHGLTTTIVGRQIRYYERAGSTNDIARGLAQAGEPEGTLVIADDQTAGRGRLGRTWVAPAGSSLLMSLVLRPRVAVPGGSSTSDRVPLMPNQLARVTMAIALGACDAIQTATQLDARIKWPNDITVRGKKCAGILSEAESQEDKIEYVIVGLGMNVNFSARSVAAIPAEATTIADELGRPFPRVQLAQAILTAIDGYYVRLCEGANLRDEWAARLITLHQRVRALTPWGEETGIAEDVDPDGALLVRRDDGSLVQLVSADVTLSGSQQGTHGG